jgi:type IV pilus assembly protein PilV
MTPRPTRSRRDGGFTLIEILVVLVLFSIGLLGLLSLQARTTQLAGGAEDGTRAMMLANELAATMWGANSVTLGGAVVTAWQTVVADSATRGLPNGSGTVAVSNRVATITVTWRAPHEPSDTSHRYVTQVVIPQAATPPAATP